MFQSFDNFGYACEADAVFKFKSRGIGIHHRRLGKHLKDKMDPLGIECKVLTNARRTSDEYIDQTLDFLKSIFKFRIEG